VLFAGDVSPDGRRRRAFTTREPVRLVAAITPFNHPLNQVAHKLAPAIAAAAPIVLKPSEKTPLAALWLARAVLEAGYPAEALAVVTGDREAVLAEMLGHEAVEVVMFTGGVAVGEHIARTAGFRRTVLELGGNDPLLVLADADLDEAASLAVAGATRNSGQRCTAVKRILAELSIADELADRIAARAATLRVGDPLHPATDVGTLIDEEAAERVERRVVAAVADGARLLDGGERTGAQIVPPVLDRVDPDSELVREETFGPAVPIVRVAGLDEALAVANGTRYGLSAGVVSNDLAAITRCIHELRCGTVNVREVPGWRTEQTPFGGVKASGLGAKEGVVEAIRAVTNVKLATFPW
jgi:aldehyde dehydrogenase (NAD+)